MECSLSFRSKPVLAPVARGKLKRHQRDAVLVLIGVTLASKHLKRTAKSDIFFPFRRLQINAACVLLLFHKGADCNRSMSTVFFVKAVASKLAI